MTINTLDDLFRESKFYYYYTSDHNKLDSFKLNDYYTMLYDEYLKYKYPTIIDWILANANAVHEWWIELDPKVIEEVNREFDLSK